MKKRYGFWLVMGSLAVFGCATPQTPRTGDAASAERAPANYDEDIQFEDFKNFADVSYLNLREKGGTNNGPLARGGGHATLERRQKDGEDRLFVIVKNSTFANFSVNNGKVYKMDGEGNSGRKKDIWLPKGPGTYVVTIGSNKYFESGFREGQADKIVVVVPTPAPRIITIDTRNSTGETPWTYIPECNGQIKGAIENKNTQLNLKISDTNCGMFDILSNEGRSLNYDAKPIPASKGAYSGSFTLPKKTYQNNCGDNEIQVRLYNPAGKDARVFVKFLLACH